VSLLSFFCDLLTAHPSHCSPRPIDSIVLLYLVTSSEEKKRVCGLPGTLPFHSNNIIKQKRESSVTLRSFVSIMNPPKSPGRLSAQFLLRDNKYHISLGEFVLSPVSHDKQRKKGDAVSALSDISVASLSKTLTSQVWVHDYLNRILHHAMLPALVAEPPKGIRLQKDIPSSRPKHNILPRILFLLVMVTALAFAVTRNNETRTFQILLSPQKRSLSPSFSAPIVLQGKDTNVTHGRAWIERQAPAKTPEDAMVATRAAGLQAHRENASTTFSKVLTTITVVALEPSQSSAPVVEAVALKWSSFPPVIQAVDALESYATTPVVQEEKTKARSRARPWMKNLRRKLFQVIFDGSYIRVARLGPAASI
jgi:hypothetical protein